MLPKFSTATNTTQSAWLAQRLPMVYAFQHFTILHRPCKANLTDGMLWHFVVLEKLGSFASTCSYMTRTSSLEKEEDELKEKTWGTMNRARKSRTIQYNLKRTQNTPWPPADPLRILRRTHLREAAGWVSRPWHNPCEQQDLGKPVGALFTPSSTNLANSLPIYSDKAGVDCKDYTVGYTRMWQNESNHKWFNKRVVPWAFPKAGRLLSIYIKSRFVIT